MKENVRPIYHELQGYLSQAPSTVGYIVSQSVWESYDKAIDELNKVTDKDYSRYKVSPQSSPHGKHELRIDAQSYRTNLGGLIARLHGEYFSNEPPPFVGMPNTIITQQQVQRARAPMYRLY